MEKPQKKNLGGNLGGFVMLDSEVSSPTINNNFQVGLQHRVASSPFVDDEPNFPESRFVGRQNLREALISLFKDQKKERRAALVGHAGIGKTVLTSQFMKDIARVGEETRNPISGFWLNAKSTTKFKEGFVAMTSRMGCVHGQEDIKEAVAYAKQWLKNPDNGDWVIVIDGYKENSPREEEPDIRSAIKSLPHAKHGFVLITSQEKPSISSLVEVSMDQIFLLGPMDPDEAKDVFFQGLGEVSDPHHADDLVRELNYIPLATRQATAYIRNEEEHSVLKYLEEFKQSKEKATELLGYESHERYCEDNDRAVLTALYLSFTSLHHNGASLASPLLSCISFLDNKSIPYSLLSELYDRIKRSLPDVTPRGLDKELKFLEDHNLVERDTKTNCYGMLQIIQLSMNAWVKKNLRDRIASDVCIDALIACWPTRNDSKDDAAQSKQLLLPHIHAIADCEAHSKEQRKDWATLLHEAGSYAFSNYMGFFARKLLEKSMESREKTLGRNHPTTLETALGYFRTAAGMKEDKETLIFGEELQGRLINELGADHVHTLICQRYLAPLYSLFGQPDKAEMVITQAYEAGCRILKEDDKERLLLSCGLAEIYQGKCQHEKARDLYAEAYELQKQRDPSDPILLAYKCRLGAAHQAMGDYETAKQILEEHLIETEERYGENSSAAAQSKVTLAELFKDTKQFQAAEPLYQEAVRLFERERGATHTDTMHMSMNLAEVYKALGRANEAEKIWDQMREILEEATERSCEGTTETMEQKLKKPTSLAPSMKMTIMTHGLIKQFENGNREQRTQAAEDMEGLVRYSKSIFGTEHGETQALLNTLMFMYLHLYQHKKFWDTRSQLIRPPPRPGVLPCPCVVL